MNDNLEQANAQLRAMRDNLSAELDGLLGQIGTATESLAALRARRDDVNTALKRVDRCLNPIVRKPKESEA